MNMVMVDPLLLEQLEGSTCFGIAHDPTTKECKSCDLQQECAAKTHSNKTFDPIKKLKPATVAALLEAQVGKAVPDLPEEEKKKKPKKEKVPNPPGMPDIKGWTVEELTTLLHSRGGTCKEYASEGIQKMRLVMALKLTYKE